MTQQLLTARDEREVYDLCFNEVYDLAEATVDRSPTPLVLLRAWQEFAEEQAELAVETQGWKEYLQKMDWKRQAANRRPARWYYFTPAPGAEDDDPEPQSSGRPGRYQGDRKGPREPLTTEKRGPGERHCVEHIKRRDFPYLDDAGQEKPQCWCPHINDCPFLEHWLEAADLLPSGQTA